MFVVLSHSGVFSQHYCDFNSIRNEKQSKNTEKKIPREAKIQTSCGHLYSSFILTLAQNITMKNA